MEAGDKFASNFMSEFIGGKLNPQSFTNFDPLEGVSSGLGDSTLFADHAASFIPSSPLAFSPEAQSVFEAGRGLWKYYHETPENQDFDPLDGVSYNPNASLYNIREYFQGRNESGKMNNKSSDAKYTQLIANLRESLKILSFKIQPKVYKFGFLRG